MPIQALQWTEFLSCPVCCNDFDCTLRGPISLGCGHTICHMCLGNLHRKQCPFDQNRIKTEIRYLPMNDALLQLIEDNNLQDGENRKGGLENFLPPENHRDYLIAKRCIENLALYLKPCQAMERNGSGVDLVSRPMKRKLVTLIGCQLVEGEGRARAVRASRSLGERSVTELILQHQNPQQLSSNLWTAVRTRGCQFLGPAMQEDVLKLVLLALEDGSALSRKVLVMFVVQRLEAHFPQASKTSIGNVVQLLYRASCFKLLKRDGDSSLMQLKDEFRTYDGLRREHDAQIVKIASESGIRIAPDQWSALLYGDMSYKSHMQSIIDKLQTAQSFAQSVDELIIALQRKADSIHLSRLRPQLELLASINPSSESDFPNWAETREALEAAEQVVGALVEHMEEQGNRRASQDEARGINLVELSVHRHYHPEKIVMGSHKMGVFNQSKYKVSMCRDVAVRRCCPRTTSCTFAHSNLELDKYRLLNRKICCLRKSGDQCVPILKFDSSSYEECKDSVHNHNYNNSLRQQLNKNNNFHKYDDDDDDSKLTVARGNLTSIDYSCSHVSNVNFAMANNLNNQRTWNLTFPTMHINEKNTRKINNNDNNNNNNNNDKITYRGNRKKRKRTVATKTLTTLLQRRIEIMNELENTIGKESIGCARYDGNGKQQQQHTMNPICSKSLYCEQSDGRIAKNDEICRIVSASSEQQQQLKYEEVSYPLRVLEKKMNDLKVVRGGSIDVIDDFEAENDIVKLKAHEIESCVKIVS